MPKTEQSPAKVDEGTLVETNHESAPVAAEITPPNPPAIEIDQTEDKTEPGPDPDTMPKTSTDSEPQTSTAAKNAEEVSATEAEEMKTENVDTVDSEIEAETKTAEAVLPDQTTSVGEKPEQTATSEPVDGMEATATTAEETASTEEKEASAEELTPQQKETPETPETTEALESDQKEDDSAKEEDSPVDEAEAKTADTEESAEEEKTTVSGPEDRKPKPKKTPKATATKKRQTTSTTSTTENIVVDPRVDPEDGESTRGPKIIMAPDLADLPPEVASDFVSAIAHTVLEFREGDIVDGKVVSVDTDGVMVDIGYKTEGFVPTAELSIRKNVQADELIAVGDRMEALVMVKEDEDGRLLLSKKRAVYEKAWGRVADLADKGITITGSVIEVVKGGLIVDIGLRGFLPASLVDLRRVKELDHFIGEDIQAKVIELDRNRNNVVLSRRAYLEEEMAEQRQAFLDDLGEGEIREGVISSVVAFGAFVDLGGMDGLIHVSELSWHHITHPSQAVSVGDQVKVKVLEVDRDRERISLSVRQTLEDPWVVFARDNKVDGVVDGTVIKTVPYGAFLSVGEGVEGLVHVSEMAIHRVESPELELTIGQKVQAKILELDEERRRVSFSIKQALPEWAERSKTKKQPKPEKKPKPRKPIEQQFGPDDEDEPPAPSPNASLEAILAELKERGIGRR